MQVRNLRTGVITDFPAKTAQWLIASGKCEAVVKAPKAEEAEPTPAKRSYKRKDLKAEG